ncbi:magnesium/cobalt transporter CorA [Arcticibacterium luteifluviistationis]|uniref:Magnesium transport protein CorA n=1 Tax=Arcticibacterium luteifluviistationis TaxID=1784714 RepID=A0A2Z4GEF8_9BACT|nr:magnesium/cobalt transporter CorA [Arcticibacterium luteifluviistationis]AWV99560.1 magnesium and cobalt transport protein CorA [Arcticibacterium luteifluviistationis]
MKHKTKVGLPPGTIKYTGKKGGTPLTLNYVEYNLESFNSETFEEVRKALIHKANDSLTQWYDIRGLHDEAFIQQIGDVFEIHSLALEDIADVYKRPEYTEFLNGHFLSLKYLQYQDGIIHIQNISVYFDQGFVLTFQEHEDDIFKPLRLRIQKAQGKIRAKKADYLAYAIIDFVVDNYFNVLDEIEIKTEKLEEALMTDIDSFERSEVFPLKKDLLKVRKVIAPLREALNMFSKSDSEDIEEKTKLYVRDVYDHTISVVDSLDTLRDILSGVQETHIAEMGMKMNKVMQFLTIITAIFVPITFLAGIYGMNFQNIPELQHKNGYFILLGVMAVLSGGMLMYFRRKKWL